MHYLMSMTVHTFKIVDVSAMNTKPPSCQLDSTHSRPSLASSATSENPRPDTDQTQTMQGHSKQTRSNCDLSSDLQSLIHPICESACLEKARQSLMCEIWCACMFEEPDTSASITLGYQRHRCSLGSLLIIIHILSTEHPVHPSPISNEPYTNPYTDGSSDHRIIKSSDHRIISVDPFFS